MDKKIIYEYYIQDGQFKKRKLDIKKITETYNHKTLYVVKPSNYVYLQIGDFDVISSNRLFSFHDNEEEFKKMFIEYYQKRIQKEEKNLERLKNIYKNLQEEV